MSRLRPIILIALFSTLVTLAFVDQAFHIDDREVIEFARVQAEDPGRLYLEDYYYVQIQDVFLASHPPLVYSLIAMGIILSGGISEVAAHASLVIFPAIAGIAMYSLGRRFTGHPTWSALLLTGSTAFMVVSHQLTADHPGAALWLAAIAAYVWAVDRDSNRLLGLAALMLMLATATMYQSLALVPLLFVYALWRRRLGLRTLLPLAVPILTYGLMYAYLLVTSGQPPVTTYRVGLARGWENLPAKGRMMLAYLGIGAVFPLAAIPVLLKSSGRLWTALSMPLVAGVLFFGIVLPLGTSNLSWPQAVILIPLVLCGVLFMLWSLGGLATGLAGWHRRDAATGDRLFLSLWILGVAFLSYVLLPYANIRHMLPMMPPLVLMFVRSVEGSFASRRWRDGYLAVSFLLGLALLALPASIADYRLAGAYREVAATLRQEYPDDGRRVWFLGEFDFRYYMEKEGFSYLRSDSVAQPGDLVIRAETCAAIGEKVFLFPPREQYSSVVSRFYLEDPFPVRTRSPWAGASLTSEFMGPLPLAVSRTPLEEITVYELRW